MSDDLSRDDDRVRPSRETPMRPARPPEPPTPPQRDYDDDDQPRRRSKSDGGTKTLLIILAIVAVIGFCLIGSVVGGFIYLVRTAVKSVGPAMAKAQASMHYKQVGMAIHNYHDKHNRFPPVSMPISD